MYTKGPWMVSKTRSNRPITRVMTVDHNGPVLCEMNKIGGNDIEADARLIAAAPEMYEALKLAKEYLGWHYYGGASEAYDAVDAVIAKVEGEAK